MHRCIIISLSVAYLGCTPAATSRDAEPLLPPITLEPPPVRSRTILIEQSAGQYLEHGMLAFSLRKWKDAIEAFESAIGTGNLNDAGRALSYWHIAQSYIGLSDEDGIMEALSSFILVSQDILDMRERRRYAVTEEGDFVTHFGLVHKIAWARSSINFVWSTRSNVYGRSKENPILVRSIEELETFAGIVRNSCKSECDFQRALLHEDGIPVEPRTEMITITGENSNKFVVVVVPND